jgi:hypothetical protein
MRDHLLKEVTSCGFKALDRASTCYGRRLWVAIEKGTESYIFLFLIDKQRAYGYGYKDMTEGMGPSYHDCPLRLLDATKGESGEYSQAWRNRVRKYHADRHQKAKTQIGDKVTVYGKAFQIVDKIRRSFIAIKEETGQRFRLSLNQIGT